MYETIKFCGYLRGHNEWVTQITTSKINDIIISSSRDKSLLLWKIAPRELDYGFPLKRFTGHSHFVSDVVSSSDGIFALSGSWDKTMLLWDVNTGRTIRRFEGHTKDVLSVDFSHNDRYIISGGRDNVVRVWNTVSHCKHTIKENGHTDWVSSVRFSPRVDNPTIVSGSWDKSVKIWSFGSCRMKTDIRGPYGFINAVAVSPDGALCASGGSEGKINIWNIIDHQNYTTFIDLNRNIQALCFNPRRYWLSAAVGSSVIIWDVKRKSKIYELSFKTDNILPKKNTESPICLSLTWSSDGQTLFAGYTDHIIRVWKVFKKIRLCF